MDCRLAPVGLRGGWSEGSPHPKPGLGSELQWPAMPGKRLILIDGYSNIFRAYYAIRHLSNKNGLPTNATYGFLNMLRKLLREEEPDLIGVALDVSADTVRNEQFDEYKANRAPMPEDLVPQIPWIRRTLSALRIPILELDKYEADDVLATLAKKAAAEGYEVLVVSADKDLMQMVGPGVSIQHTGREKVYDAKAVEEDFGVPPEKIVDLMALKGDTVDNVPGVPGIGEKGAQKLIQEFGSLEELLERADEVQRKSYREGLIEHRDKAILSKELVTLHDDLDIEFDPDDLEHDPPDPDELRQLYSELGFTSLLEELEASVASGGPIEVVPAAEAETAKEWSRLTGKLKGRLAISMLRPDEPFGMVVGGEDDAAPVLADFRRDGLYDAALESLAAWLGDGGRTIVTDDLKELLRPIPEAEVAADVLDTMLASYLGSSAGRSHGIEGIALERLQHKLIGEDEAGWVKKEQPEPGWEPMRTWAGERTTVLHRLVESLERELEASGSRELYDQIERPLVPVLARMEETGILLDCEFLSGMSEELGGELAGIEGEIYEIAGEEFNINSPRQLGEILFEKLDYPVLKRTKKTKSYSTSAEILQELANRGFPLPELVLRYRELSKLKSTYVDALPALVGDDGRLHTRYEQAVAATGRLSSVNPNLQNIPVRTEVGQRIRKAFIAPEGRLLLVADYSQIELRILAHVADDEGLLEAFRAGKDIHRSTAAAVLGVAEDLVSAEQRRAAKVINFGILYGMSAFGLANNLGISQSEAKSFIEAYLAQYPGVQRYVDETAEAAKRDGKVETLYGRVRWLPEITSRNFAVRENARRMAINAPIQGTAADLQKKAMIAVDGRLRVEHPEADLLLTVHDELVLEVPEGELEAVTEMVTTSMMGVAELAVPLVVEAGAGRSWYDAKL